MKKPMNSLQTKLRELEGKYADYRTDYEKGWADAIDHLMREVDRLASEEKTLTTMEQERLRYALSFYAQRENYTNKTGGHSPVDADMGHMARLILKDLNK